MAPQGKQVVVHIGLLKAASSTLQGSLKAARGALDAAGIAYPGMGAPGAKDQIEIHDAVGEGKNAERRARALAALRAAAAADRHTLVLSGEMLFASPPSALRLMLRDTGWGQARLTVVAIVRDTAGWLNSRYGYTVSLFNRKRGFRPYVRASLGRGMAEFDSVFAPWLDGSDITFRAVPMRARSSDASVVTRTLDAMGIDPALVPVLNPRNEALDPRTIEAARRLSLYPIARGTGGINGARRTLVKAARAEGFSGRFQGLDDRIARQIEARTQESCDRFAHKVWGKPWSAVYDMPEQTVLRSNEWRGGGPRDDARAIARVVCGVADQHDIRRSALKRWQEPW